MVKNPALKPVVENQEIADWVSQQSVMSASENKRSVLAAGKGAYGPRRVFR